MRLVPAALLIYLGWSGQAQAYVDPGSGMFILQILAAMGIGVLFYFRKFIGHIKNLFPGSVKGEQSAAPDADLDLAGKGDKEE